MRTAEPLTIRVDTGHTVSGLMTQVGGPVGPRACLVLAHGAGAGMRHPFLAAVADGLAARGVACLRYQFPYMEARSKRPDRPALAMATVRAAVASAVAMLPGVPVFAGGKSFGGRMTSTAQASAVMPGVRGLLFLGFPLHPAGKPSVERARHLSDVDVRMLFVQGTRDALADPALLRPVLDGLGSRVTLLLLEDADHSFHVRARSGTNDAAVLTAILDGQAAWMLAA